MRVATQRHTAILTSRIIAKTTPPQFAVIAKLLEIGPCLQNHLGRLISLDAATIKGVVDRLRICKFVITQGDLHDRRRHAVTLTGLGRRTVERAARVAAQIMEETLAPLTAAEQQTVLRLRKKLG